MRYWATAVAVLTIVAMLQAYTLPYFRIWEIRLELMLPLLVAWAFVKGVEEAMVVVPLGGLLVSFFSQEPLGISMIAYAPIVPLALVRETNVIDSELLLAVGVAMVATFAYTILYLLFLDATGYTPDWLRSLVRVAIPTAFTSMILAPLFIVVMRSLESGQRGTPAAPTFIGFRSGRRLGIR
jgi:rod shape-determining protein MreD